LCAPLYVCKSPHTVYATHILLYTHIHKSRTLQGVPPFIMYAMCLYVRDRIRLARDADSIFIIIIIIIFNTSRTGSRIMYYVIMRSAVGIVPAILYYNENVYWWQRAACRSDDFWATTPAEPRSANCERLRDE